MLSAVTSSEIVSRARATVHPVLFEIGDFPVGTYALAALLAVAAGVSLFGWLGRREGEGYEGMTFVEMGLWAFIIGIAVSKLFALVVGLEMDDLVGSASRVLRFSGHYYVAFLAGTAYLVLAMRRRSIPLGRGLDALAPALAFAHGIGRVGCFMAGCCWGEACSLPWAATFTDERAHAITGVPLGVALHPTQLYEAGANLLIAGLLLLVHFRVRAFAGHTFLSYVVIYGVTRFSLEELRADPRGQEILGLSTTQALLVPTVAVALALTIVLWRRASAAGAEPLARAPSHPVVAPGSGAGRAGDAVPAAPATASDSTAARAATEPGGQGGATGGSTGKGGSTGRGGSTGKGGSGAKAGSGSGSDPAAAAGATEGKAARGSGAGPGSRSGSSSRRGRKRGARKGRKKRRR